MISDGAAKHAADRIEIRPLVYADLPAVIAVERRVFTTPWSLPMFVLELSKPSGICLAAVARDDAGHSDTDELGEGELVGYLICAHYDQAWHLMNIAVEPERRRQGIARALIDALIARAGVASTTRWRFVSPTARRSRSMRNMHFAASAGDGAILTTARTRSSCGARSARRGCADDPGDRDEL